MTDMQPHARPSLRPRDSFTCSCTCCPGILVYVAINVGPVYRAELRYIGVSGKNLQFGWVMLITFGWHMFTPFLFLRFADKLTFRQSLEFLGLDRIDLRGLFLVLPVYCAGFAIVSLPYMSFLWNPISAWLRTIPAFQIAAYSIFQGGPDGLYSFPPVALLFLFIGNFLGEELYFRGYLLKKTAFLGNHRLDRGVRSSLLSITSGRCRRPGRCWVWCLRSA